MPSPSPNRARIRVDGKFFRLDHEKFHPKGLAYGPFAPNERGESFPSAEQAARDLAQVREARANLLRVYHVPPRWFLELADQHQLRLLVDIPWGSHLCFLDSSTLREAARTAIREGVRACLGHPAVFAFSVANEIPPDIIRWSGAGHVADFIDELVEEARLVDPECLCTFTNFPPTEFLRPQALDFVCYNVYLHRPRAFEAYLARLQMIADGKPLVLGECGVDAIREGEAAQAEMLSWQIETAFRAGLAGGVVFSYTDEWFRGGQAIVDWGMGITTCDRLPKPAFEAVRRQFLAAPHGLPARCPRVSVVVACYNGAPTLRACLQSLTQLNYPDYEVILVDDGSTDTSPEIAALFKTVRYIRHANHGLSVARNTGLAAATGEIVAFTDADCRADEDWLRYLVGDLVRGEFVGMGGHNLPPPEDSPAAAAVLVSPGGPAHVMLTDRLAEHIPGCNMAFYKWALEEIGGFDPIFRKAGDDVDICWRLQQRGYRIGFSPAGFVWHYRRANVAAYLRQQRGYGEAEALLVRKHPEYFNSIGRSLWQGRIYSPARSGVLFRSPMIYRGAFGSGFFQTLYAVQPAGLLALFTSLEYHVLVTLPLLMLTVAFPGLWPVPLASFLASVGIGATAGAQAAIPRGKRRWWSRPLVALLFLLQPLVRSWARYRGRLSVEPVPPSSPKTLDVARLEISDEPVCELSFWSEQRVDRLGFLGSILEELDRQGWPNKADTGWTNFDVEILGNRWGPVQLVTAAEQLPQGRQVLRCRLRSTWSFEANLVVGAALGAILVAILWLGGRMPWVWLLLLTVPAFAWFVKRQQRELRCRIAALLEGVAKHRGLVGMDSGAPSLTPARSRPESPRAPPEAGPVRNSPDADPPATCSGRSPT